MDTLTFATFAVLFTDGLVWLAFYLVRCHQKKRLPFGKLRVRIFRYLMQHTADIRWRTRWAILLFGSTGYWASRCYSQCIERLMEDNVQ